MNIEQSIYLTTYAEVLTRGSAADAAYQASIGVSEYRRHMARPSLWSRLKRIFGKRP